MSRPTNNRASNLSSSRGQRRSNRQATGYRETTRTGRTFDPSDNSYFDDDLRSAGSVRPKVFEAPQPPVKAVEEIGENTSLSKRYALDLIDRAFDQSDHETQELSDNGTDPTVTIDERGFVNLSKAVYQEANSTVYISELEFVYSSVILLRTQQIRRYGFNNIPYTAGEVNKILTSTADIDYPAAFAPYFECLGTVDVPCLGSFNMKMHPEYSDDEDSIDLAPQVSLSKLERLLTVQDTDPFEEMREALFADDPVLSTITANRSQASVPLNCYQETDARLAEPLAFINLKAIDNFQKFVAALSDKCALLRTDRKFSTAPMPSSFPEVSLIRIEQPYDLMELVKTNSSFKVKGKAATLAAAFQLYTPTVDNLMPRQLMSADRYSFCIRRPNVFLSRMVRLSFDGRNS